MEKIYGKLNYIFKDQHEEIEELERQIDELNAQIIELNSQIAELNLQIESLQGDIALLTQQKEALEAQVAALEYELEQVQPQISKYRGELEGTTISIKDTKITQLRQYAFYRNTTIEEIIMPNLQSLGAQTFYGCTKLKKCVIPFLSSVSKFYQCYDLNPCLTEDNQIVPLTQNILAGNEFTYCGQNINTDFIYKPTESVNVFNAGSDFTNSGLTELEGTFVLSQGNKYCQNEFKDCKRLSKIKVKLIGNAVYIFSGCNKVSQIDISESDLTGLSYAFYEFGTTRDNISSNILTLDFRGSTTSFACGNRSFYGTSYMNIFLPTVTSNIANDAFTNAQYNNVRLDKVTPPTINGSMSQGTNKFFVPLDSYSDYHSATNWSALTLDVWKHYTAGDTLDSNYTWYSDIRLTNQVTGTAPETADYYGVAI